MLSLPSLAVAPLRPVEVGEGCILLEDDLDGTLSKSLFFLGVSVNDSLVLPCSLSTFVVELKALSESSVKVFWAVDCCVVELGGWETAVTIGNLFVSNVYWHRSNQRISYVRKYLDKLDFVKKEGTYN